MSSRVEKLWLDRDVPCVHCGYNLRGMTISRACPECGAPACESLLDELLDDLFDAGLWITQVEDVRDRIAADIATCPIEAARFVSDAAKEVLASRNLSGDVWLAARGLLTAREICWAVRSAAVRQQGSISAARKLLAGWGITSSRDVGRVVGGLIQVRRLRLLPHQHLRDFEDLLFFTDTEVD